MSANCDPNQLANDARCWDSCTPLGMMESIAISGAMVGSWTPPTQPGIRGEGANEFILDEGGQHILPE